MNEEEAIGMYKELKRNKKFIGSIDTDFFFEFAGIVLNLLEKKDKMIDEMATYITTLDIEEDICEKTKNEHCDKMNFGECEDCIKQYFEYKLEEDK